MTLIIEVINEYKPIKRLRHRMNRYDKVRKLTLVKRRGKWYLRRQWKKDKTYN